MLLGENSDHIHKLFGNDVQYEVPRYQRRYVWDETNWRTLWEDILSQEKLGFQDRGHFTGPIVTRPIRSGQLDRFEVIDGQQRLTTFQIIFCVIRDLCKSQGHDGLAREATRHIVNTDTVIRKNTSEGFPDPTYKFIPTDYDKLAFQKVVEEDYGKILPQAFDESENHLNPELVQKVRSQVFGRVDKISRNILDAYDYFYIQITAYVGKDCDYDKVSDLITSIKYHFNLIHITLGSSDQPEKIFESLNATGRMLSEFDYLRNNLFLRAGKLGEDGNGRSYSDIFYDDYWHFENDSHYWDAETLDSFFRAFLMAKLGPDCFEAKNVKPFELYREYSKGQIITDEFKQLSNYAKSYKKMKESTPEHMQFYDHFKLPRLEAFILFVHYKSHWNTEHVCNILESYIVRRLLCYSGQYSYEQINTFFSKAIEQGEFSITEFIKFLFTYDPSDADIREAFKQAGSKDPKLISYVFCRMENRNPYELNSEDQMTLLSENLGKIEDTSNLTTLNEVVKDFNQVWALTRHYKGYESVV